MSPNPPGPVAAPDRPAPEAPARIVVCGAGGLVGRELTERARGRGRRVAAFGSTDWDITDPAAAARHIRPGDVVINCAAYTQVDAAETDPDAAYAVNAVGPGVLAQACARADARLIHISTDYVFSGTKTEPYEIDDSPGPVSVYGRTKLAGEAAVRAALPGAHIVRTAWVYRGGEGRDFVAVMQRLAAGDGTVEVVDDQVGSPTYVADLVTALLEVADKGPALAAPVLHAANAGAVSRYEQARAVFELLGADPQRVRPVGSDRHPRPAPRPVYSALSGRRSAEAGLTPLRGWREALAAALAEHGPLTSRP